MATATIYNNQTYSLSTQFYDFIEPAEACTFWNGSYGIQSLPILDGTSPISPNIPYININTDACGAFPFQGPGSLTGTFDPNGFVGLVIFNETVTDGAGNLVVSNTLNLNCVSPSVMTVNAGPDATTLSPSYGLSGSFTPGSSAGPWTYLWSVNSAVVGTSPTFSNSGILNPTVSGLTYNGTYEFELTVTPSIGSAVSDTVVITRSGAAAPFGIDSVAMFPSSSSSSLRTLSVSVSGGTPPYSILIVDDSPDANYLYNFSGGGNATITIQDGGTSFNANAFICGTYALRAFVSANSNDGQSDTSYINGTGTCFPAGTQILLPNGSHVNIESLKEGDEVQGTSILVSDNMWDRWKDCCPDLSATTTTVVGNNEYTVGELISINNGAIKAAIGHPFLTFEEGTQVYKFKPVESFIEGEYLVDKDDNHILITSIVTEEVPGTKVYELSTNPWNTYIANNLIVHNKQQC